MQTEFIIVLRGLIIMDYFTNYIHTTASVLREMIVTDHSGRSLSAEEGIDQWIDLARELQHMNRTLYFVGNGASAMMASHMAADACKNLGIRSQAFNDTAFMTAISNDIAYEECFAIPIKLFADTDDVLVSISSSGNSPNIIRAIETARELAMKIVTISGFSPDNRSRQLGSLNFYLPGETYGIVEVSHQVLLHCWLDRCLELNEVDAVAEVARIGHKMM